MSATPTMTARKPSLTEIMQTRTAAEWEEWLQARHVPASRVRTMGEALADPQIASRECAAPARNGARACTGAFTVPVAGLQV